jgi:hypothetical protein
MKNRSIQDFLNKNNKKNGNRYLAWAYIEAANFVPSDFVERLSGSISEKWPKGTG